MVSHLFTVLNFPEDEEDRDQENHTTDADRDVGILVDSEIDWSTRKVIPGCLSIVVILTLSNPVLINKTLSTVTETVTYQHGW